MASCIEPQATVHADTFLTVCLDAHVYMCTASWHGTGTLLLMLLCLCDAGLMHWPPGIHADTLLTSLPGCTASWRGTGTLLLVRTLQSCPPGFMVTPTWTSSHSCTSAQVPNCSANMHVHVSDGGPACMHVGLLCHNFSQAALSLMYGLQRYLA